MLRRGVRAEGLPITVIIIAALGLALLVILLLLQGGYLGGFAKKLGLLTGQECPGEPRYDCLESENTLLGYFEGVGAGQRCCVPKNPCEAPSECVPAGSCDTEDAGGELQEGACEVPGDVCCSFS